MSSAPSPQHVSGQATEPHRAREAAESFGADAERYDRTRPRYPDVMVAQIVANSPGHDLLDVGIGTAIAAEQFRAAGCQVLGVDVDPRMAEFARRRGFEVDVATFEAWDPAGRTFDAVISGQTWHWIDAHAGAVRAARVLRPGGRIALFWNVLQPPPPIAEAFASVQRRVLPGPMADLSSQPALATYEFLFRKAEDGINSTQAFAKPQRWRFDWELTYTRDEWLDVLPTQGIYSRLPPGQLEELQDGMGAAIDAVGGSFSAEYATVVITASTSDKG